MHEHEVFNFDGPGIALSMYNLDKSIREFAQACLNYGLARKWPVYFSTKNTILKAYDGRFKDLFEEVYQKEFKDKINFKIGKGFDLFKKKMDNKKNDIKNEIIVNS